MMVSVLIYGASNKPTYLGVLVIAESSVPIWSTRSEGDECCINTYLPLSSRSSILIGTIANSSWGSFQVSWTGHCGTSDISKM